MRFPWRERGYEQARGIPEGKAEKEKPGKSDHFQALPSRQQNHILRSSRGPFLARVHLLSYFRYWFVVRTLW